MQILVLLSMNPCFNLHATYPSRWLGKVPMRLAGAVGRKSTAVAPVSRPEFRESDRDLASSSLLIRQVPPCVVLEQISELC